MGFNFVMHKHMHKIRRSRFLLCVFSYKQSLSYKPVNNLAWNDAQIFDKHCKLATNRLHTAHTSKLQLPHWKYPLWLAILFYLFKSLFIYSFFVVQLTFVLPNFVPLMDFPGRWAIQRHKYPFCRTLCWIRVLCIWRNHPMYLGILSNKWNSRLIPQEFLLFQFQCSCATFIHFIRTIVEDFCLLSFKLTVLFAQKQWKCNL